MIFAINTSNSYVINSTGLGILYRVNFLALRLREFQRENVDL